MHSAGASDGFRCVALMHYKNAVIVGNLLSARLISMSVYSRAVLAPCCPGAASTVEHDLVSTALLLL